MSSMTACGENTTWGATIDGSDIPAGIFIYYLQSAYYSAQSKLNEENSASSDAVASADGTTTTAAVFSSQIDGKDAKTWIYDEATKSMQEYAAIEAKFTELGLTITADEKDAAKVYCDQTWDYAGEYYTKMGISEKSFTSLYLNSQKRDKVFKTIYSGHVDSFLDTPSELLWICTLCGILSVSRESAPSSSFSSACLPLISLQRRRGS